MARAREAIRSRGGAIHSNVFTRFMLAMFGVLTWRSVPVLPVEIMLLPMWSPFHLNKISYWARTTIVPLMVLAALKPRAKKCQRHRHRRAVPAEPHSIGMTAKRRTRAGLVSAIRDWTACCGDRALVSEQARQCRVDRSSAIAFIERG